MDVFLPSKTSLFCCKPLAHIGVFCDNHHSYIHTEKRILMSYYLRTNLLLTAAQANSFLPDTAWTEAENTDERVMKPCRLTLDENGKFASASLTDAAITPATVGMHPVYDNKHITIDALVTPINKGEFIPGFKGAARGRIATVLMLPIIGPENLHGYIHEHFHL